MFHPKLLFLNEMRDDKQVMMPFTGPLGNQYVNFPSSKKDSLSLKCISLTSDVSFLKMIWFLRKWDRVALSNTELTFRKQTKAK